MSKKTPMQKAHDRWLAEQSAEANDRPRKQSYSTLSPASLFALTTFYVGQSACPDKPQREMLAQKLLDEFDDYEATYEKVTRWFRNRRNYCKKRGIVIPVSNCAQVKQLEVENEKQKVKTNAALFAKQFITGDKV